ncbi:MAG: ATP-dependent DNA ligase [Burkholderiales bacterium]|nr:ATP-dependent DNA ligase [Opitutaceae bacterium]
MSWEIRFRNGIHLPQLDWWLDAHHPVARSFVSHAHFDHLAPHREMLLSPGTAALMRARLPDRAGDRIERELPFGQTAPLSADHPEVGVTLYPAGHIHGSAMILLEHPAHGRLLYTGDFKLRPGRSAERCEPPRADVVIMETTYGRPHYTLPPTDVVLADVIAFCRAALEEGDTPVLFGYSLGKSQEILRSLADAALPVMLHPQTLKLTAIYEALGVTFPAYASFDAPTCAGHVVICPPQAANSAFVRKIPRRRTAALTGWALDPGARFRYQCDAVFPLSDHADYPDLLRFVELTRPRRVLTLHGFAADFARDLRERGVEAWAINQDNQLEIPLSAPAPATPPPSRPPECNPIGYIAPSPPPPRHPSSAAGKCNPIGYIAEHPATLESLASIAERIRATPSKSAKVALLRDHFAALATADPADAGRAALHLTGRAFPQSDPRTLSVGWSLLRRAVLEVSGRNEGDFRAAYRRFGDSGDTAEALLAAAPPTCPGTPGSNPASESPSSPPHPHLPPSPLPLADLESLLARLAATASPAAKLDLLVATLHRLSPLAAKYLIKIITGDLRIGLREGLVVEVIAAASSRPLEAVREADMLCGDLPAVVRAAFADTLAAIALRVFHPLQFMLASPEPDAEAILARLAPPVWLEEKYDGIRCQLHKQGDRVELYSRDLHRITDQFPELVRAARRELPADCILDGELLAWRDDRALPFAELQKRLNRRLDGDDLFLGQEIPLAFSAYDLLWLNEESLLRAPLRTRRAALESLFAPEVSGLLPQPSRSLHLAPVFVANTVDEVDAAFLRARRRGNEGLMAKDPASPYTPGRRGLAWLKLKKAYATLDVVVVAVELGHGKRKGVLSDYTFAVRDETSGALLTVGKAYSGLTDAEIAALTEHFIANTLEERGRLRLVVPDTVLEIAFDNIHPSSRHDSGFALRFPRIARIRTDKTPADIDTLATCRRLATVTESGLATSYQATAAASSTP